METERQTESVLAKLMGINRLRPQQPHHRRQRVLSVEYSRGLALINHQLRRSLNKKVPSKDASWMLGTTDAFQEPQASGIEGDLPMGNGTSKRITKSNRQAQGVDDHVACHSLQQEEIVPPLNQDYLSGYGSYYSKILLKSSSKMTNESRQNRLKRVHEKVNKKNEKYEGMPQQVSDSPFDVRSGKRNSSPSVIKEGSHNGRTTKVVKLNLRNTGESMGCGSKVGPGIAKQITRQVQDSLWLKCLETMKSASTSDVVSGQTTPGSCRRYPNLDSSVGINVLNPVPSKSDPGSRTRNLSVHKDWCFNMFEKGTSDNNVSKQDDDNIEEGSAPSKSSIGGGHDSKNTVNSQKMLVVKNYSSRHGEADIFEQTCITWDSDDILKEISAMLKDGVYSSSGFNASIQQVVDDELLLSHKIDEEYWLCLRDPHTSHTDSVPISEPLSSAPQLEDVSVGNKVRMYSDVMLHEEYYRVKNLNPEEHRDFCYLVNALSQSNLQNDNLEVGGKMCKHLEQMVDPLVFSKLEEAIYGRDKSWRRSERRLLFDRINFLLTDVLHPYTQISSVRNRRSVRTALEYNNSSIKEEVWSLLVSQAKSVGKGSSEPTVDMEGNCTDLGEEMYLVEEIERLLVDELVKEIVGILSFRNR